MNDEIWYLAGGNPRVGFMEKEYDAGELGLDGVFLGPMNRINIFVGANSSGKSRLMRKIMTLRGERVTSNNRRIHVAIEVLFQLEKNSGIPEGEITFTDGRLLQLKENSNPVIVELKRMNEPMGSGRTLITKKNIEELARELRGDISNYIKSVVLLSGKEHNRSTASIVKPYDEIRRLIKYLLGYIEITLLLNNRDNDWLREKLIDVMGNSDAHPISFFEYFKAPQILDDAVILLPILAEIEKEGLRQKMKYVPILRSSHRLWDHQGKNPNPKLFGATTKENYRDELPESADFEIFTGQELFARIVQARNGHHDQRQRFVDFEKFIGRQFFQGRKVDIVAEIGDLSDIEKLNTAIHEKSINVKVGGKADFPVHKLGDGIQALIMLTFPIFMAEPNTMIFIEEPELNLHPGMQRIFLEVISQNEEITKKNLTFFMTTHSNHFLDLTLMENAPVSIFTLRENEQTNKFEIKNVHSGNKGILEQLGVQNSSVFIGNCSIWVEGHTDRKYIRKYLQELTREKKFPSVAEDLHYVFFEYGGANLAHYRYGEGESDDDKLATINGLRLNNAVMVVGDRDQLDKAHLQRFREMESLGFQYLLPEDGKEIENLLSPLVLSKILPRVEGFKKNLKDKAAQIAELKHEDYIAGSLRKFIDVKLLGEDDKSAETSFTASQKREICELSMEVISWKNMSVTARKLALDVYNFIAKENRLAEQTLEDADFAEPTTK